MKTGIAERTCSPIRQRPDRRLWAAAALLLSVVLSSTVAAQQEPAASEPLTLHLTINGEVDPQTIFVFRYMIEGGPLEQVQLCGGFDFPGATSTLSNEPCEAGWRYTTEADLEPGAKYAIQVSSMHPSDHQATFGVLAQTFEGEGPPAPGDFLTFQPGTTHWVWVNSPVSQ